MIAAASTGVVSALLLLNTMFLSAAALDVDFDSSDSIHAACALVADGLMDYYWGKDYGGTVGMFTHPYYWWQAGGAWGSMIDYSFYFDNDTYDDTVIKSMIYQAGPNFDYMPLNQTVTEGNDDQVFWGIAAIQAAERNFTNPPAGKPSWIDLASAVFNTMKNRWDTDSCGGGLRWQIFPWNSGYDYKNTISNAGLFHLGSRLLRYTGNESYYQEWNERVYDWLVDVKFIDENHWVAYDGAKIYNDCTNMTYYQWTYNSALMISGCAYMYNYTGQDIWKERVLGFLGTIGNNFFDDNGVMYEQACQRIHTCKTDQRAFRAYLARCLALTAMMVPETYDTIYSHLVTTAKGVAQSCVGGYDHHTCGQNWSYPGWDSYYGLGEQMSSLEVMQNVLMGQKMAPLRLTDGASSSGDALFGNNTETTTKPELLDLDKGDEAGAAIITVVIGISVIVLAWFVTKK